MPLTHVPQFETQLATTADDRASVLRLRYDVFVRELGATGPQVDHAQAQEVDDYDRTATHLILRDLARPADDQVIGTYRLISAAAAAEIGQFYCAHEYDLRPLLDSGLKLLELGRSCLHRDYRGGAAMLHLWAALADYVETHQIDLLFGVASFHGTDAARLAAPLSLLHHRHLAPAHLRVQAKGPSALAMDMLPPDQIDRVQAMRDTPALIKAYLRIGGTVGAGAFVDHSFNTTDVCLILQRDAISALQRQIYTRHSKA